MQDVLTGQETVLRLALLLDVREGDEVNRGHIPKAINLPVSQLRSRYAEIPKDREIWVCCAVGPARVLCYPIPDAARLPSAKPVRGIYNVYGTARRRPCAVMVDEWDHNPT